MFLIALYMSNPQVQSLYILSNWNETRDDPVVFALTDRINLATGAKVSAVLAISI